jgi:hypothetical protein
MNCPVCGNKLQENNFCVVCQKRMNGNETPFKNSSKQIKETKCTCAACGNVWYYGKQEMLDFTSASLQNEGKAMACCCSGCLPALFIPDKKAVDPSKCPKCGSRAVHKEDVIHNV